MMILQDAEFFKELLKMFRMESDEHVRTIINSLEKLRNGVSSNQEIREIYETAFRAAHSLKGAARIIGLTEIEPIGLSVEKMIGLMKQQEMIPSAELNEILMRAVKSLSNLIKTMNEQGRIEGDRMEVMNLIDEASNQVKIANEGAKR